MITVLTATSARITAGFIWGEIGVPDTGLYDRALGVTYLLGLWEALEKTSS